MFQRIRELEAKLEIQKRHLKELEEKVGGVPCPPPPPLGLLSVTGHHGAVSFCTDISVVQEQALPPAALLCPVPPRRAHLCNK